jgi:hypothetical protein
MHDIPSSLALRLAVANGRIVPVRECVLIDLNQALTWVKCTGASAPEAQKKRREFAPAAGATILNGLVN